MDFAFAEDGKVNFKDFLICVMENERFSESAGRRNLLAFSLKLEVKEVFYFPPGKEQESLEEREVAVKQTVGGKIACYSLFSTHLRS